MTITLLRWCSENPPKRDGRVLQIGADGFIDEVELDAFDAHLRAPWPNKNPGLEILRELARESRGKCGLCLIQCDSLEVAHIDRYGLELDHHCQHPRNLINLCPNCHSRYDRAKSITNDTIKHAKSQLVHQLMADVDLGRAMQDAVRASVATLVADRVGELIATNLSVLKVAQDVTGYVEAAVTGSVSTPPTSPSDAANRLAALSGSLSAMSPLTSRLVASLGTSFGQGALPAVDVEVEDLFEWKRPAGRCDQCSSQTPIDRASCSECETDAGWHEYASDQGNGLYELFDEDVRGDWAGVSCKECGSKTFEVEFRRICTGCEHFIERANED